MFARDLGEHRLAQRSGGHGPSTWSSGWKVAIEGFMAPLGSGADAPDGALRAIDSSARAGALPTEPHAPLVRTAGKPTRTGEEPSMASTSLTEVPTDSTASSIRRRVTAAIASALAAAVLAALVVAAPTPASAAPRAPADPAGAYLFRNGRFTPLGGVPGAQVAGHLNLNNRGQVVGAYPNSQGVFRSFVKDRAGRVTTFAVPGASATLAWASTTVGRSSSPSWAPACPG
jgi:hypothetical protein